MTLSIPIATEALPLPRQIYLEVINRCNSLCATCPLTFAPHEAAHALGWDEFLRLTDQFPTLERVVLHGIGEPLMNPDLPRIIRHLKDRGAHVLFNSNAILLNGRRVDALIESGLDEIRVSVDGATPETYFKLRGVKTFPKVIGNLRRFLDRQRELGADRPRVSLWMTGTRANVAELPNLVELAAEIGVAEVYLQRLTYFGEGLATEDQAIYRSDDAALYDLIDRAEARAKDLGIRFAGAGEVHPRDNLPADRADRPWTDCRRPWRLMYLTANGNALPCCIAPFTGVPYDTIVLGNIHQAGSVAEVWNGDRYRAFRAAQATADPPPSCRGCGLRWSL